MHGQRRTLRTHSHKEALMTTFICYLNWTDQGAKNAKDSGKRYQASRNMAEKLGGKIISAYVTTGQYDVVATVEMPNGEAMAKLATRHLGDGQCADDDGARLDARGVQQARCRGPDALARPEHARGRARSGRARRWRQARRASRAVPSAPARTCPWARPFRTSRCADSRRDRTRIGGGRSLDQARSAEPARTATGLGQVIIIHPKHSNATTSKRPETVDIEALMAPGPE